MVFNIEQFSDHSTFLMARGSVLFKGITTIPNEIVLEVYGIEFRYEMVKVNLEASGSISIWEYKSKTGIPLKNICVTNY